LREGGIGSRRRRLIGQRAEIVEMFLICGVTPVLIFPGWILRGAKAETGVVVLNDDMISDFFESRPTVLSDEQITNISSHLDQTARS